MAVTRASSKSSLRASKEKAKARLSVSKVKKPVTQKKKASPATRSTEKKTTPTIKKAAAKASTKTTSITKKNTSASKTTAKTQRPGSYRECMICAETKPLGRGNANFPSFSTCFHPPSTCTDCVTKNLFFKLKSSSLVTKDSEEDKYTVDWSRCTCPQCNNPLLEKELRSTLSRQQLTSIETIIANKTQEGDPNWMLCLSSSCVSGQRVAPSALKKSAMVICVKCRIKSCFYHRIPWHEGYTCSRYDDEHPNAQSARTSEERIRRITKKCPNEKCGWRIQKNGGCPGMFCPGCNLAFSWDVVKYDKGVIPEPEAEN